MKPRGERLDAQKASFQKNNQAVQTNTAVRMVQFASVEDFNVTEKHTKVSFAPGKAIAATLLASVAASGAATTIETFTNIHVPGIHETIDTRHIDQAESKNTTDPTVVTLKDGTRMYIPAMPDEKGSMPAIANGPLSELAESAAFGTELHESDAKTTRDMNEALSVLSPTHDPEYRIDSVITRARTVALSDTEAKELTQAAASHRMTVAELINAYKHGELTDTDEATGVIEELLVVNPSTVEDLKITDEAKNETIDATLYKVDQEYILVAEHSFKTEHRGGTYPIVVLPIPVPWFRRRTYYTRPKGKTVTYDLDAQLAAMAATRESLGISTPHTRQGVQSKGVSSEQKVDATSAQSSLHAVAEMQTENPFPIYEQPIGGLHGIGGPGGAIPSGESADKPSAEVLVTETQEGQDKTPELTTETPTTKEITDFEAEAPTEEPAHEAQTESIENSEEETKEEDTEKTKRRLVVPRWLIAGTVVAAAVASPYIVGAVQHHHSKVVAVASPSPTPSGQSQPGTTSTPQPENTGAPLTPAQKYQNYIYEMIDDTTASAQSLTRLDGTISSLNTVGAPVDAHLFNDISYVKQPEPPTPPAVPTVELKPGDGGEALMRDLGKNPAEWYPIAHELEQVDPSYFYGSGNDVRIAHSGLVPQDVIEAIEKLAK